MLKYPNFNQLVFALALSVIGLVLIGLVSARIALGVFLCLWSNNINRQKLS